MLRGHAVPQSPLVLRAVAPQVYLKTKLKSTVDGIIELVDMQALNSRPWSRLGIIIVTSRSRYAQANNLDAVP
jgi:hypothetical protein